MKDKARLAQELYEPKLDGTDEENRRKIGDVIGHLPGREALEVFAMVDQMHHDRVTELEHFERVHRLALASGCPEGKPIIPWLIRKKLLMKTPSGDLYFTPNAAIGGNGKPEKLALKREYEIEAGART